VTQSTVHHDSLRILDIDADVFIGIYITLRYVRKYADLSLADHVMITYPNPNTLSRFSSYGFVIYYL